MGFVTDDWWYGAIPDSWWKLVLFLVIPAFLLGRWAYGAISEWWEWRSLR